MFRHERSKALYINCHMCDTARGATAEAYSASTKDIQKDGDPNKKAGQAQTDTSATTNIKTKTNINRQLPEETNDNQNHASPWSCLNCTFSHERSKALYINCHMCGTARGAAAKAYSASTKDIQKDGDPNKKAGQAQTDT